MWLQGKFKDFDAFCLVNKEFTQNDLSCSDQLLANDSSQFAKVSFSFTASYSQGFQIGSLVFTPYLFN